MTDEDRPVSSRVLRGRVVRRTAPRPIADTPGEIAAMIVDAR
jgi:hypothetical protein